MSEQKSLTEYLVSSFLIHFMVMVGLFYSSPVTNGEAGKIEIQVLERTPPRKSIILPPSPAKSLIPGRPKKEVDKKDKGELKPSQGALGGPPVKLEDYADHLKAAVDPVWYAKMRPLMSSIHKVYTTNVLLFPDTYGNIVSVKVIGSSGRRDLDQAALDTFRKIGRLPKPPELLVKEGIIWDFTITPEGM